MYIKSASIAKGFQDFERFWPRRRRDWTSKHVQARRSRSQAFTGLRRWTKAERRSAFSMSEPQRGDLI